MPSYRKRYRRRRYGMRRRPLDLRDPALVLQAIREQYDQNKVRGSADSITKYGRTYQIATADQRINRLKAGWKGRGDYGSSWKPWLQRRKNYRGRGDYGGDAGGNQIMAGSVDVPLSVNASTTDLSGDVYLSHREFIGNVSATGGVGNITPFKITQFPLNAGLQQTFPWLSQIAQNFEMYELIGCIFEYRPTSGELGATGSNSLGKVVMATNYDPDAPGFNSTVQMENYDYANACKPSEHMMHGIETKASQRFSNMLYIRTGTTIRDKIFTDYGTFSLATEGLPITSGTTANIGELWVAYKVRLSRAQLYGSQLGNNVLFDSHLAVSSAANLTANTASYLASTAYPTEYTTAPALTYFPWTKNTLGCVVTQNSANQSIKITFPDTISWGVFRIVWEINCGAASTISFNNPTFNGGMTYKNYNGIDGAPTVPNFFGTSLTAATGNVIGVCTVACTAAPTTAGGNYVILSWVAADASNNKLQNLTIALIPAL